jgi:hypothetical protein
MKIVFVILFSFINIFGWENEPKKFNNIKSEIKLPEITPLPRTEKQTSIPVITESYLIANASKKILFGYVKDETQYKNFVDMYTKLLKDNRFKISEVKRNGEMVMITYFAHYEMGIRRFIGDDLSYNAKDDNEIIKLMNEIVSALENNGIRVIGKYLVKTDILRPTFMIYYLTEVKDFQEKEIKLRLLKKGEDIDFDLLENVVTIIRKDTSFSMLYLGKEIGFVSKLAINENDADKKLEEYRKFLKENRKEFINYKVKKLDKPFTIDNTTYNFLLNIYFFQ